MSRTPHPMNTPNASQAERRGFFWQGLFILLPVVILSAVGLYSLRQDRVLAEAEARQTAQRYADEVARVVWTQLRSPERLQDPECFAFRLDERGELIHPPPAPVIPAPQSLDVSALDATRLEQWRVVFASAADRDSGTRAIRAAEQFLRSNAVPKRLGALVQFELGKRLLAAQRTNDALRVLGEVEVLHWSAVDEPALTESGLPLAPLAAWKRLEAAGRPTRAALDAFGSNLVQHPTFLTPLLLDQAMALSAAGDAGPSMVGWKEEWIWHESLRDLAAEIRAQLLGKARGAGTAGPVNWPSLVGVGLAGEFHSRQALSEQLRANPQFSWRQHSANQVAVRVPLSGELDDGQSSRLSQRGLYFHTRDTNFFVAARIPDGAGGAWMVGQFLGRLTGGWVQPNAKGWAQMEKAFPPAPAWLAATIELAGHAVVTDRRLVTLALRPAGKGGGQTWSAVETFLPPEVLAISREVERGGWPSRSPQANSGQESGVSGGAGVAREPADRTSDGTDRRAAESAPHLAVGGEVGETGGELLRVKAHLVSPELLYGGQQARTRMFGLLIGVSAVAALVGFVAARRAFVRQQRLAEMQSNFVSSVSHELRAPIASVRLMAESLERGAVQEPARQHDYFRFIVQECRRLGTLIENVLDFARIDQGRKQYEPEPTDLAALIRRTIQLMEPSAREKSVTIDLALPSAAPTSAGAGAAAEPELVLAVDPQAMQQALINLVDNALKHSPPGGRIEVGLRRRPGSGAAENDLGSPTPGAGSGSGGEGGVVELWVEDAGPGIPAEEHERIFERFYRRGSELRRSTPGVGIGLSIVRHIVEAHGGRVRVRSAVGEGSRFTIELRDGPGRPEMGVSTSTGP